MQPDYAIKNFQTFNESEQVDFGKAIAGFLDQGMVIFLEGELGAGKTTLARGIFRGLGYEGKVKSPTYTLVEEYLIHDRACFHFDLYRLADPEELEFMGIRDFALEKDILLIEWPEKGRGFLPAADLVIDIKYAENGRNIRINAITEKGKSFLEQIHFD